MYQISKDGRRYNFLSRPEKICKVLKKKKNTTKKIAVAAIKP